MKLNDNEVKVLTFLADGASDEFGFYGFASIINAVSLDRKEVRRACRSLARKGLAEYGRGLWNDGGEPAGSGYGVTRAGIARMKS